MEAVDRIFSRAERMLGGDVMRTLATARVILFGVGGVGSWCAEGLIRSGVGHLTIVDSDCVSITNVNRQLMATTATLGRAKVDALRERLLEINPAAVIDARQSAYTAATADEFSLETYDYIIDAIDSLENKALLIRRATATPAVFFSSMGAALKMDPLKIDVAEFWKVSGCPLARALRNRFKRDKLFPERKFLCVYSPEVMPNRGAEAPSAASAVPAATPQAADMDTVAPAGRWDAAKAQINGSLVHTTAIFGFMLAGLVVQDISAKVQ